MEQRRVRMWAGVYVRWRNARRLALAIVIVACTSAVPLSTALCAPPPTIHFEVSAPTSVTAGVAFNFTVRALNPANNVVHGYSGTVHFNSTDGAAVLPANTTLTNGVGTFSATLNTVGSQSITATDTVTASITGISNAINVTAGAAMHFSVSAPASATAGSPFNFTVTALDAANNTVTGYSGTVHFTSTDGAAVLPANTTLTNGVGTFSATLNTVGSQSITATDTVTASITGISNAINIGSAGSSKTTLTSSRNPSNYGQSVTFTAAVTGATPTGNVTFKDGGKFLGTGSLNGSGQAIFSIKSLSVGEHFITATYNEDASNPSSTSSVLTQTVGMPADSIKLRNWQIVVTKIVAQSSGQAISGAIDSAILEGWGDGALIIATENGVRFNFAAEPQEQNNSVQQRVDDAMSALGFANGNPTHNAPSRQITPKEWFPWAEVRGTGWNTNLQAGDIQGGQINALIGLTYRPKENLLIGGFGSYEDFDYTSQLLSGQLKGDGWTIGAYLGWRILPDLYFNAGVARSEISYSATVGTAAASFPAERWLATGALIGKYKITQRLEMEPSAKVYALWEHDDVYTDNLGTSKSDRTFSTGRASLGTKLSYPLQESTMTVTPYIGFYADYYFNRDDGTVPIAPLLLPIEFVDGWSARATTGLVASIPNAATVSVGGELGGLASGEFTVWSVRGRAVIPF